MEDTSLARGRSSGVPAVRLSTPVPTWPGPPHGRSVGGRRVSGLGSAGVPTPRTCGQSRPASAGPGAEGGGRGHGCGSRGGPWGGGCRAGIPVLRWGLWCGPVRGGQGACGSAAGSHRAGAWRRLLRAVGGQHRGADVGFAGRAASGLSSPRTAVRQGRQENPLPRLQVCLGGVSQRGYRPAHLTPRLGPG